MSRFTPLMCGLALWLASGDAFARTTDFRDAAAAPATPVAVSLTRSDQRTPGMQRRKPNLKGDYVAASRAKRKNFPRKAPSTTPLLYADIFDYGEAGVGVYSFTPAEYGFSPVKIADGLGGSGGAAYANGLFYAVDDYTRKAFVWDTDTWTLHSGPIASELVVGSAMAADPADGTIYSCAYDILGRSPELVIVDSEEFVRTATLGSLDCFMSAMFFDLEGNLLGFDGEGRLYELDKSNASMTLRGETGIDAQFGGGAVVDPASGVCFYAVDDWTCSLFEVDLETCNATLLYDFDNDEEIKSLFILPPAPAAAAPAKVEDLAATFTAGSLGGVLTFTAPTQTYGGATGSGPLAYSLTCNDAEIASGACTWGEPVTVPYTAAAPGMHSFVLTMSADGEESRPAAASLWIGPDTPAAVTGLTVKRTGGSNELSWNASDRSVHGGYVDFDALTYRVTRFPDNVVVSDGQTGTFYSDALPDGKSPMAYYYTVTAIGGTLESEAAKSGNVMVGALYHNSFDTQEQFNEFLSVTLAKEGPEWHFDSWHKAATVGYNEEGPVSAWLISPAVTLEADVEYTLTFDVWCSNSDYNEQMSVFLTRSNVPATIYSTTPLIEKMDITNESSAKRTVTAAYTPEVGGTYYLTFNGCSGVDLGSVYIDNVMLYRTPVIAMPAAPEIKGEIMGGTLVMLSVTAPSADTDGNPLDALERITVSRGDVLIKTIENPTVGETYNFTDMLPKADTYYYTAIAYTADGPSAEAKTMVSAIEAGKPRPATGVKAAEDGNSGTVTLTWDAPATDLNNRPIEPGSLTYAVYVDGVADPVETDLAQNSYTWQAVEAGEQQFMSFHVVATNEAGSSYPSGSTVPAPYGTPAPLPYAESFAGMQAANLWNFYNSDDYSEGQWLFVASSATPEAEPADADGGMLAFTGEFLDDTAWATTGKIDLGSGDSPRLTFQYFAVSAREGKDQLDIYVGTGSGYKLVDSFTMRDSKLDGWTKHTVDLSAYAGQTVSLRFAGTSFRTGYLMLIDNIEIVSSESDLAAGSIVAPASVIPGVPFKVEAVVANNGLKPVGEYKVNLYRNGAKVADAAGPEVPGGAMAAVSFEQTADASWDAAVTYRFEVAYAADQVPANNASETVSVEVSHNDFPAVADISAAYADQANSSVEVRWSAPDRTDLPAVEYTENFEFMDPFAINPECDWTFVDGDGSETFGSSYYPFPGQSQPMAYIVFDANHFNVTYAAHSGNQYLASMSCPEVQNDDWMISPELTGEAQTVSFFARSYSDTYGLESFQVLASASGTDKGDFTVVAGTDNVPVEWTPYRIPLPEGSRYFAIRCVSSNVFAFFVDDVTFTPAVNPASKFGIEGYNVYRNGERLNDKPLNALSFTDYALPASTPEYAVSVVYDHGESPLSPAVAPGQSSIAETEAGAGSVRALAGAIEILATGHASVCSVDGRVLFSAADVTSGRARVSVAPGVYIVTAAGKVWKLKVNN